MMQLVVYVLLLVYQTPTGASAGVRQYIDVFPTEAACQAKARKYQPDENAREANTREMLNKPHADSPTEKAVDAYPPRTCSPENLCLSAGTGGTPVIKEDFK